jgi:hypothetical protein
MQRSASWNDVRYSTKFARAAISMGPRLPLALPISHSEPKLLNELVKATDPSKFASAFDVTTRDLSSTGDVSQHTISQNLTTIASMIDPSASQPLNFNSTELWVAIFCVIVSSVRVCTTHEGPFVMTFCRKRFKLMASKHKISILTTLVAKLIFVLSLYFA